MRPIYKSLALAATTLQVSLALNAETRDDESASTMTLQAELLDSLRVELVAQNVSGARNLIESGECIIDGSNLTITLDTSEWTRGAMYRVQVLATFGTQTQVIYALNVTVPYYIAFSDTPQEYEDTVTVVSTITDVTEADLEGLALEETSQEIKAAITPISQAADAYNVGKTQLAEAITSKGVETSPTESYPEMAEKVNAISQETYEINGGEMYAKQLFGSLETPNYWNLYDVLSQLLSDGRLINYGGILLAEYYRGYDSLALYGAGAGGAYVVSDKDENGQFKMYTEDATHTWATEFDGKGNRWVAYCFADEGHEFVIDNTDTSPRSIFIGRKVGTIRSTVAGHISQIVVPDGNETGSINLQHAMNWGKSVVIRNINQSSGVVLSLYPIGTSVITEEIYIHTISFSGGSLVYLDPNKIPNCVIFESKEEVAGGDIFYNFTSSYAIVKANGSFNVIQRNDYRSDTGLKELFCYSDYLNLNFASGGHSYFKVILNYIDPNDRRSINLIRTRPDLTNGWAGASDVVLKENWCKPINISNCSDLTEASMFTNILQRLKQDEPDCGDGVTITLGSTNLAKLTSEESVQLLDDLTNIYGYTFA